MRARCSSPGTTRAATEAIVEFVDRATREGDAGYIPPSDRVAVFDNDGTLWCEKPMPIELGFILRRLAEMCETDTHAAETSTRGRPRTRRITPGSETP